VVVVNQAEDFVLVGKKAGCFGTIGVIVEAIGPKVVSTTLVVVRIGYVKFSYP